MDILIAQCHDHPHQRLQCLHSFWYDQQTNRPPQLDYPVLPHAIRRSCLYHIWSSTSRLEKYSSALLLHGFNHSCSDYSLHLSYLPAQIPNNLAWSAKTSNSSYSYIIYMAGNLRCNLKFAFWSRWRVILYKLLIASTGILAFYIGFHFMRGGYKIAKGLKMPLE